jgi:hypothetical protein
MRYTPASILVAALGATLALGACNLALFDDRALHEQHTAVYD